MAIVLNNRDFEAIEVITYSDLVMLCINPEEVKKYLLKNVLLGNFGGLCSTCGKVK